MKFNRIALLVLSLSAAWVANAAEDLPASPALKHVGAFERMDIRRADELLERATDYLQKYGTEQSFRVFDDRRGPFVSQEFYVFVVGLDGILYASGGAPAWEIGSNALEMHDASKKYFIREMLDIAKTSDSGTVEYNWLNRADNRIEVKTSHFQKIGKYLVCVGYYIPRASIEEATVMLDKAVDYLKKYGGAAAFKEFNDPHGRFFINDEYVFAIGLNDGKYRASGAAPNLTGTDVRELTDAAGNPLFKTMIALAKEKGSGSVDYVWRNPATNAVEHKHSLIRRVDDVLLGVGYYTKD